MRGMLTGIGDVCACPSAAARSSSTATGQFQTAFGEVRKHLREIQGERVLVGAANDPSALGALRAFEEAGRAGECAIVGQNAEPEARAELRLPQYAPDRQRRLLPGKVRRRADPPGARHFGEQTCPAGRVHRTS